MKNGGCQSSCQGDSSWIEINVTAVFKRRFQQFVSSNYIKNVNFLSNNFCLRTKCRSSLLIFLITEMNVINIVQGEVFISISLLLPPFSNQVVEWCTLLKFATNYCYLVYC